MRKSKIDKLIFDFFVGYLQGKIKREDYERCVALLLQIFQDIQKNGGCK